MPGLRVLVRELGVSQSTVQGALFGQKAGLPIAGASPRKIPALLDAVRRLAALGHRRVVSWAENVAKGRDDRRQTFTLVKFIDGGTVGPAVVRKI